MRKRHLRIAFLASFASRGQEERAFDAVGYGLAAADLIARGLLEHGIEVVRIEPRISGAAAQTERRRLEWIYACYRALLRLRPERYDCLFVFDPFHHLPLEIRRIRHELKFSAPIVGYSEGYHWDPADAYPSRYYPGMQVADAANLLALDRVLVVTGHLREVLVESLERWQPVLAERILERVRVVGLPIDRESLDAARAEKRTARPTILFNHPLIPNMGPEVFLSAVEQALETHKARVVITSQPEDSDTERRIDGLKRRFPGRIVVGGAGSSNEYFQTLWRSEIQVSTANYESFGGASVQAMYARNCCILPNRFGYREITGGFTETLYDSPEEFFTKLDFLLGHPKARRRAGDRLHEASLHYTPERVIPRIAEVIKEAVAQSSAA